MTKTQRSILDTSDNEIIELILLAMRPSSSDWYVGIEMDNLCEYFDSIFFDAIEWKFRGVEDGGLNISKPAKFHFLKDIEFIVRSKSDGFSDTLSARRFNPKTDEFEPIFLASDRFLRVLVKNFHLDRDDAYTHVSPKHIIVPSDFDHDDFTKKYAEFLEFSGSNDIRIHKIIRRKQIAPLGIGSAKINSDSDELPF